LDGPEGSVDWPGHLFPQLRVARTRKRAAAALEDDDDVSRVLKFVEIQRRIRTALLEQHKRPRIVSSLPRLSKSLDPFQVHQRFLHDLLLHRQQFVDFHRRKRDTIRRVGHAVVRRVAAASLGAPVTAETAEARLQRERIAALKAQDEEAYLRLLAESKNERLNELIRQTEEYMRTLGALVVEHKGQQIPVQTEEENSEQHGLLKAKAEYFALTHAVEEVVGEQPSSLNPSLKLRDYQLKGLEYLVSLHNNRLSGILADEQGLGKSATTIAFLAWLWENRGIAGPFMIVAPLSVLKSTWVGEVKRWCPGLAEGLVVYEGHKEQRKELKTRVIDGMVKMQQQQQDGRSTAGGFTILLTTDAYILKDQNILRKVKWEYIVVDEAHRLKNPKSKLVQVLNKNFNSNYRLALTGTPLQNDLQEVWALLNFLQRLVLRTSGCGNLEQKVGVSVRRRRRGFVRGGEVVSDRQTAQGVEAVYIETNEERSDGRIAEKDRADSLVQFDRSAEASVRRFSSGSINVDKFGHMGDGKDAEFANESAQGLQSSILVCALSREGASRRVIDQSMWEVSEIGRDFGAIEGVTREA
jgi:SNF2 family DNA or RNA helicase